MIAFGPVPSRRLGRSLGINNVPPKVCSYSCVYCQLGQTVHRTVAIRNWYKVEDILESLIRKELQFPDRNLIIPIRFWIVKQVLGRRRNYELRSGINPSG